MPEGLLRALDVSIGKRMEGLLAGDFRSTLLGTGLRARDGPSVRPRRRRAPDRLERDRADERAARARRPRGARPRHVARARHDPSMQFGTADRRKADVAEGVAIAIGHLATRRGNRLGIVTYGDESTYAIPPRQGRVALLGLLKAVREEQGGPGTGAASLGEALARTGALARQKSLVVVVSDFRGPRDWRRPAARARRAPRRRRGRGPRPARAGALERRAALARGPGDRPPAARRHAEPQAQGTLRRRSGRRAGRSRRRSPRPASGTSCCRPPVTGCARSSPSSAGAARELRVADRAARARAAAAARRPLPLARQASRRVPGPVREPRSPAEHRSIASPVACATCPSSCSSSGWGR